MPFERRMKNFNPCISEELEKELIKNPKLCERMLLKDRILAQKIHKIVGKHIFEIFKKVMT